MMPFELPSSTVLSLPNVPLSVFVNQSSMMVVLLIAFIIYLLISGVLIYHWDAFGMKTKKISLAKMVYFSVSFILLGIAAISVYYF